MDYNQKKEYASKIKIENFGNTIKFAYPNQTLALTTTNNECSLNCAHCNGHYLKNMTPIEESDKKIKERDITSLLLSGGCTFDGDVPINKHLDKLKELKEKNLKLNAHIGLMDEESIKNVCKYLDVVSFDLVFDKETIKEVYKIDKTKEDYIKTYENIKKYAQVIPHICIGLKGGKIKGEYEILEYLKKDKPNQVTFIILIPTKDTEYADVTPPYIKEVADFICEARINLPQTTINLGCMRPRGPYRKELDCELLDCGINSIVLPNKSAQNKAKENEMIIIESKECCVL